MIIAWTKLFHAFFQATIGERYFYTEKNGRYKIIRGRKKGMGTNLRTALRISRKAPNNKSSQKRL